MKRYDSDEDLERALLALPLEEPPADLRGSILAATIYRAPAPFKLWEAWTLGTLVALAVWAIALLWTGGAHSAVQTLAVVGGFASTTLFQTQTLFWLAVGAGATFWIWQVNLLPAVPERLIRR